MRRVFLVILSLLYLSVATGASIHFHYCMGELAGWSFWKNNDKQCDECGMNKKAAEEDGCCKDEFKQIKINVDQKSNTIVLTESPMPFTGHCLFAAGEIFPAEYEATVSLPEKHKPLRRSEIPRYLLNCLFRL